MSLSRGASCTLSSTNGEAYEMCAGSMVTKQHGSIYGGEGSEEERKKKTGNKKGVMEHLISHPGKPLSHSLPLPLSLPPFPSPFLQPPTVVGYHAHLGHHQLQRIVVLRRPVEQ